MSVLTKHVYRNVSVLNDVDVKSMATQVGASHPTSHTTTNLSASEIRALVLQLRNPSLYRPVPCSALEVDFDTVPMYELDVVAAEPVLLERFVRFKTEPETPWRPRWESFGYDTEGKYTFAQLHATIDPSLAAWDMYMARPQVSPRLPFLGTCEYASCAKPAVSKYGTYVVGRMMTEKEWFQTHDSLPVRLSRTPELDELAVLLRAYLGAMRDARTSGGPVYGGFRLYKDSLDFDYPVAQSGQEVSTSVCLGCGKSGTCICDRNKCTNFKKRKCTPPISFKDKKYKTRILTAEELALSKLVAPQTGWFPSLSLDAQFTKICSVFERQADVLNDTVSDLAGELGVTNLALRDLIGSVSTSVVSGAAKVESTIDSILAGVTKSITVIGPLICILLLAFMKPTWFTLTISASVLMAVAVHLVPKDLWDFLLLHFGGFFVDTPRPQGMFDVTPFANIIACISTFSSLGMSRDFSTHFLEVSKNMSQYRNKVSGWSDFVEFFMFSAESAFNTILTLFGRESVRIFRSGVLEVDSWAKNVDDLRESVMLQNTVMDFSICDHLSHLLRMGTTLLSVHRLTPGTASHINRGLTILNGLCAAAGPALGAGRGRRPEPACMCLYSRPGCGKTAVMDIISKELLVEIISDERLEQLEGNLNKEIWRSNGDKYSNGYASQKITMMDDIGQTPATASSENHDWRKVIDMVNTQSYPLNMADVESKGKTFFTSSVLLCTTNVQDISKACSAVVHKTDAVTRRLHFPFELHVVDSFLAPGKSSGEVDCLDTVKFGLATMEGRKNAFYFTEYNFVVGSPGASGVAFSVNEVVDKLAASVAARTRAYESTTSYDAAIIAAKRARNAVVVVPQSGFPALPFSLGGVCEILHGAALSARAYLDWLEKHPFLRAVHALGGVVVLTALFQVARTVFLSVKDTFVSKLDVSLTKDTVRAMGKMPKVAQAVFRKVASFFRPEDFVVAGEGHLVVHDDIPTSAFDVAKARAMAQSNYADPHKVRNQRVYKTSTANNVLVQQFLSETIAHPDPVFAQSGDVTNSIVTQITSQGTYAMSYVAVNGGIVEMGYAQFLCQNLCVFPKHFVQDLERVSGGVVRLDCISRTSVVDYPVSSFLSFKSHADGARDLCFMLVPNIRMHRNLLPFLCKRKDFEVSSRISVRMETQGLMRAAGLKVLHSRHSFGKFRKTVNVGYKEGPAQVLDLVEYLIPTAFGDCGAIITFDDAPWTQCRKILGIHIAGYGGTVGLAATLSREYVDTVLTSMAIVDEGVDFAAVCVPADVAAQAGTSFQPLGFSEGSHSVSTKTSLRRSPLFEAWCPCVRREPHLDFVVINDEPVSSMTAALANYGGDVIHFDVASLRRARHIAAQPLMKETADTEIYPRVPCFPFEVACAGDPHDPTFKAIPRGTSRGVPHVLKKSASPGKYDVFGSEGPFEFTSVECARVKKRVHEILENAKVGKRSEHLFMDFLKDETRKPGKTPRLISAAPLEYTIAFRMLFMSFTTSCVKTRISNGMGIGMNAYQEFHNLALTLQSKGRAIVAGDFKGFDSSLQPQLLEAAYEIIAEWYGADEWSLARRTLWLEVISSRHLGGPGCVKNFIYGWSRGLPSGHPATSFINSLCNLILFCLVWGDLLGAAMAPRFWEFVSIVVYGDDNILNVDDSVVGVFNQQTIVGAMSKYGMTYTNEAKDDAFLGLFRNLDEVSFLKRTFRKEGDRWLGALEMDSVLCAPYWLRTDKDRDTILASNIDRLFLELSLHDPFQWIAWQPLVTEAVLRKGVNYRPSYNLTRDDYQLQVLNDALIWD